MSCEENKTRIIQVELRNGELWVTLNGIRFDIILFKVMNNGEIMARVVNNTNSRTGKAILLASSLVGKVELAT